LCPYPALPATSECSDWARATSRWRYSTFPDYPPSIVASPNRSSRNRDARTPPLTRWMTAPAGARMTNRTGLVAIRWWCICEPDGPLRNQVGRLWIGLPRNTGPESWPPFEGLIRDPSASYEASLIASDSDFDSAEKTFRVGPISLLFGSRRQCSCMVAFGIVTQVAIAQLCPIQIVSSGP
jgi:hypothetical protein